MIWSQLCSQSSTTKFIFTLSLIGKMSPAVMYIVVSEAAGTCHWVFYLQLYIFLLLTFAKLIIYAQVCVHQISWTRYYAILYLFYWEETFTWTAWDRRYALIHSVYIILSRVLIVVHVLIWMCADIDIPSADISLDLFSMVGGRQQFYSACGATELSSSSAPTSKTSCVVEVSIVCATSVIIMTALCANCVQYCTASYQSLANVLYL